MSIFTRGKVYLSADRATYLQHDPGTGEVSLYVDGVQAMKASATAVTMLLALVKSSVQTLVTALAKVGATAGWVVNGGAVNTGLLATCPASQTGSTLVIPLTGVFNVGDTITGVHLVGQIESGGNAVTLDMALRKMTAAAADVADASVGSMTQLSVTADTIISSSNAGITGLSEVVGADETFYLLVTATTLGSTDIALQGAVVTRTTN